MKCSNCDTEVADTLNALVVLRGPGRAQVAAICAPCQQGVLTLKIVLSRSEDTKEFAFEGYLPVATQR